MKQLNKYRNLVRRIHAPEDVKQNILDEAAALHEKEMSENTIPAAVRKKEAPSCVRSTIIRISAAACACAVLIFIIRQNFGSHSHQDHSYASADTSSASAGSSGQSGSGNTAGSNASENRTSSVANQFYLAAPDEVSVNEASLSDNTSVLKGEQSFPSTSNIEESASDSSENEEESVPGDKNMRNRVLLALHSDGGNENFSGNEFYIRGQNIQSVTLRIDRDGFYLAEETETTDEEKLADIPVGLQNDGETDYEISYDPSADSGGTVYRIRKLKHCGREITLEAGSLEGSAIGFYTPVSYTETLSDRDQADYFDRSTDYMNGAVMNISITYKDGSTLEQTYTLSTGKLKASLDKNSLKVDNEFVTSEDEPWVYGVLLAKES